MKNNKLKSDKDKAEVNYDNFQPFTDIRESYPNKRKNVQTKMINDIKNKMENLKIEEIELEKMKKDIEIINKKFSIIQKRIDNIEKDNKNLDINPLNNNEINYININDIINKYIKLEENYSDLLKKFEVIKEDQNKNGEKVKKNAIDFNSGDIESNLNMQTNKIIIEQQNELNAELKKLNIQINTKNYNDDNEIKKINSDIYNLQQQLDIFNNNLNPIKNIEQMKLILNVLNGQIKMINDKIEQISNENNSDEENNLNISQKPNDEDIIKIKNIINLQRDKINNIKGNYSTKNEINDINNKLNVIEYDINRLIEDEENKNYSNSSKNNSIGNMMISRNDLTDQIQIRNNEYKNLNLDLSKDLNSINNIYQMLRDKYFEYNSKDIIKQSNYKEIIIKITEEINENKNDINNLNENNDNNYKIFEQIKRNFKIIDSKISKIKNIEQNEYENKAKIGNIQNKLNILENILNKNNTQIDYSKKEKVNVVNNQQDIMRKINDLNDKGKNEMEYLENEINKFIEERNNINNQMNERLEQLNRKIQEKKNNRIENSNLEDKNEIKTKNSLYNLEENINSLNKAAGIMNEMQDQYKDNTNEEFKKITERIKDLQTNISNKFQETQFNLQSNFRNISQSLISHKEEDDEK